MMGTAKRSPTYKVASYAEGRWVAVFVDADGKEICGCRHSHRSFMQAHRCGCRILARAKREESRSIATAQESVRAAVPPQEPAP